MATARSHSPVAQRLGGLGDRQRSADAVVGDARVRALQHLADADVPQHVVGQRPQQPHRIDRRRQFAAEGFEAAGGRRQQREVVVLVQERAAARADVDAAAVVEATGGGLVERRAPGGEPGALDRAVGGVQAEHVGAADVLQQLAVAGQRRRVVVAHLGGELRRPARGVPLRDRADRGVARRHGREDRGRRTARAADRAAAGDQYALRRHQSPVDDLPSTSSGLRKARQLLEPPKPSEFDSASRTRRARGWSRMMSTSHSGSGVRRLALTGSVE